MVGGTPLDRGRVEVLCLALPALGMPDVHQGLVSAARAHLAFSPMVVGIHGWPFVLFLLEMIIFTRVLKLVWILFLICLPRSLVQHILHQITH